MIKYKVVLADDHQFFLEGILAVLKEIPSLEILEMAKNGYELMDAVEKHHPHLVVLDLNMPGYDGLECLKKIKSNYADTKVLILTNYGQSELIEEVRKMHADGYLIKNSSAKELSKAIVHILSGGKFFPVDGIQDKPSDNLYFFDDFLKKYQLTKREVGIIRLICGEMNSKQMAATLFLSELTIHTHRRNILRKLEVKNVAGLINFAKQNNLI
jgi:DNA-binding NarL/FixJ family response regulator